MAVEVHSSIGGNKGPIVSSSLSYIVELRLPIKTRFTPCLPSSIWNHLQFGRIGNRKINPWSYLFDWASFGNFSLPIACFIFMRQNDILASTQWISFANDDRREGQSSTWPCVCSLQRYFISYSSIWINKLWTQTGQHAYGIRKYLNYNWIYT